MTCLQKAFSGRKKEVDKNKGKFITNAAASFCSGYESFQNQTWESSEVKPGLGEPRHLSMWLSVSSSGGSLNPWKRSPSRQRRGKRGRSDEHLQVKPRAGQSQSTSKGEAKFYMTLNPERNIYRLTSIFTPHRGIHLHTAGCVTSSSNTVQ